MSDEELFEVETNDPDASDKPSGDAGWWRDLCVAAHLQSGRKLGLDLPLTRLDEASAIRAFPLAGLLIGLAGALMYLFAHWIGLLPFAASVVGVVTLLWLTRAQDETRIAQFFAGENGDGSNAAWPVHLSLAACSVLLLKVALLSAITDATTAMAVLIAASLVSRGAVTAVPTKFDLVTDTEDLLEVVRAGRWFAAVLSILLLILFLGFWDAVLALVILTVVIGAIVLLVAPRAEPGARRIHGLVQQTAEITVLLLAAATY